VPSPEQCRSLSGHDTPYQISSTAFATQPGKPLCPCSFYPNGREEVEQRTWICACDDMQIYKYCHCLLFVNLEGKPITEYLPEDHDGRRTYGFVEDPTPDKGRPLRANAAKREPERRERNS